MRPKQCLFCSQDLDEVDYKDVGLLRRFVSEQGKIISTQHTGTCAKHQRKLAMAIKNARFMDLLPFVKQ